MVEADPGAGVPRLKAYKSPELRTEKFLISGRKIKVARSAQLLQKSLQFAVEEIFFQNASRKRTNWCILGVVQCRKPE